MSSSVTFVGSTSRSTGAEGYGFDDRARKGARRNTHIRSRGPAWRTEADAAVLAKLVHELVRVAFAHRERCPTCQERGIAW
jgi:hypothetical protein